jgi:NADP-dependent 3-hydroxy acid dehydrogenase YdfG
MLLNAAMDLPDTKQCLALFAKVKLEIGTFDELVNNAGMCGRD